MLNKNDNDEGSDTEDQDGASYIDDPYEGSDSESSESESDPEIDVKSERNSLSRSHLVSIDQVDGNSDPPSHRKLAGSSLSVHSMDLDRRKISYPIARSVITVGNQASAAPVLKALTEVEKISKMVNLMLCKTRKRRK